MIHYDPCLSHLSPETIAQVGPSISEAETALSEALARLESEGFTHKHRLVNTLQCMRCRLVKLSNRLSDRHINAIGRAGR